MIKLLISGAKQISKEQIEDEEELRGYIRIRSPFNYMSKHLKIAMLFSSDPRRPDGLLHHLYFLSEELRKLGHKVFLFGPNKQPKLPFRNYIKFGKLIELNIGEETTFNIVFKSNNNQNPAETIEKKEKFDLIHFHDPYIPFVSLEVLKKTKLPVVATFHTAWDSESGFNFFNSIIPLFQETFNKVRAVIFVSKIGKLRWGNLFPQKTIRKVIPNGIDCNLYHPINFKNSKRITILFVARIVRRKGLLYLLEAIKNLTKKFKDLKLIVLGDGPQLLACKQYAKKNHLEKYVDFKGYITGKAKIRFYQEADIFCAPYVNEAFGITILEAMACGIPIVGFNSDGISEILKNYPDHDLIVPRKNIKLLEKSIYSLINDNEKRNIIKKWLLNKSKEFDWKMIARETEDLYYKVLSRGRVTRPVH